MIKEGKWGALKAMPSIFHDGLAADYTVIDDIHRRLQKHPERNPLRVLAFTELVDLAISAWDDDSIGKNHDDYLANLLDINPETRQRLIDRGYFLNVKVTVEPDPADDTTEAPVEALSH